MEAGLLLSILPLHSGLVVTSLHSRQAATPAPPGRREVSLPQGLWLAILSEQFPGK